LGEAAHQPTVDGDSLFGSLARRSGSLQPLGPGQIHEVKLGRQRLVLVHLRVSISGDSVVTLTFLLNDDNNKQLNTARLSNLVKCCTERTHIVGGTDANLAQVDGEDGVGPGALDIHLRAGGGATQSPELQALHHLTGPREKERETTTTNTF